MIATSAQGESPRSEFFGRESEKSALQAFLDSQGGLLLVSGEAGVGKSRLVDEVAYGYKGRGQVLRARPELVTRPGPYGLIVDLLDDLRLSANASVRARTDSFIQQLTARRIDSQSGELTGRRTAAEVRGLLGYMENPLIIVDDLHSADEASQDVLFHLARTAIDDRHHFIVIYRSDEIVTNEGLVRFLDGVARGRLAREIAVGPLDERVAREMILSLRGSIVPESEIVRIVAYSDGVAFYVEELATSSHGGIPESIARSIQLRLSQLGDFGRQLIEAAALSYGSLDPDTLSKAFSIDRSAVIKVLVDGVRLGILVERDNKLLFRHSLLRESILEAIPEVQRQDVHARLAQAIEDQPSTERSLAAPLLAHHWYGARSPERSLPYALAAGEGALAMAALHDAREFFQLAIACTQESLPSAEALVGVAEVEIRSGEVSEAEALLRRALARFVQDGDLRGAGRAVIRLSWLLLVQRRGDEALTLVTEAHASAYYGDVADEARLLLRKGQILLNLGLVDDAETLLSRLLKDTSEDDHWIRADVLDSLGLVADQNDDYSGAAEFAQRACDEALASGDTELVGKTHNNRALWLILRGDVHQGLSVLSAAREVVSRSFGSGGVAIIDFTEAIARWRLGEPERVQRLVGRHEAAWARFRGYARILESWAAEHLGDEHRAGRLLDEAWVEIGIEPQNAASYRVDESLGEVVLCALVLGAERPSVEALPLARLLVDAYESHPADERALVAWLMGRIAAACDDIPGVIAATEMLKSVVPEVPTAFYTAAHAEIQGLLSGAHGNYTDAAKHFEGAIESHLQVGNFVDRARCHRLLAGTLAADGARDDAIAVAREGLDIAKEAGGTLESRRIEGQLRTLGVRPRAGRPRKDARRSSLLSQREEEVAMYVARGSTNAEIAARLYLSERTVQDHITHALRKLELPGRAALAAWVVRQEMT